MTYITADEVRNRSGAPSSLITDAQLTEFIAQVERDMEKWINTVFAPKSVIEVRKGNNLDYMFTRKNPLLSVRKLTNDSSTVISPSTVNVHKPSGKISLTSTSEAGLFVTGEQNTFIKYLYGLLEESSTETDTTAAASIGTSVALAVTAISGFTKSDWIEIYGMDGKREVAQINDTPTGTTIQVDELVHNHESGSIVVLLQIPEYIKNYMLIEAAICAAINAIGATYVFNASYSLGDLSVTKGVPYTHWQSSVEKLYKERAMRKERIKIRPSIVVD